MKNQQAKEAAAAKSMGDKAKAPPGIKQKGIVLSTDHRDQSFEYWPRPSELELAHLAARLARTEKIDSKQLVKEAWEEAGLTPEQVTAAKRGRRVGVQPSATVICPVVGSMGA